MEKSKHMFGKVLTPSDDGRLSRIVIPKQHAEAYFPPLVDNKEAALDFTDKNGKIWSFGYSNYGNDRYVLNKGWKHFVKEKKLFAGDTVCFHRGYIPDDNRPGRQRKIMYICCRHRSEPLVCDSISAARVDPSGPPQPLTRKKLRLFGVDIEESSFGETSGEMGVIGCSSSSLDVIKDVDQSSGASPRGEMGASSSSFKPPSDDENHKRKRKCLEF